MYTSTYISPTYAHVDVYTSTVNEYKKER